jgi:hypothetical protein
MNEVSGLEPPDVPMITRKEAKWFRNSGGDAGNRMRAIDNQSPFRAHFA